MLVAVLAAASVIKAQEEEGFRLGNLPEYVTLSGTKRVSTSYTQLKGQTRALTPEGVNINQSLNLLLEGRVNDRVGAHLRYDDSQEMALEMRLDYHQGPLEASFGDIELSLSETEFTQVNKSLFGLSATSEFGPVRTTLFGARTKGVSRTRVFRGTAIQGEISFYASDYQQRTYYQLPHQPVILDSETVIFSNLPGGEQKQEKGIDYELDYTEGILNLTEPLETNTTLKISYQHNQGTVEGLVIADPSGSVDYEIKGKYYWLGQRNLIEGSESVWVDGEAQTRGVDYTLDYQAGVIAFTVPFDPPAASIEVAYEYRFKAYYLDSPVVFGSERVRVDGRSLSRGGDYAINYQTGLLTFFDRAESIFEDSVIIVDYQFEEEGAYGQDAAGIRGKYQAFDWFGLGATYLYQADRRVSVAPSLTFSPGSLQVFGFDANLTLGEHLNLEGELAGSKEGFKYDSLLLIDDFEGEEVIYDGESRPNGRWRGIESETELQLRLATREQQPDKVQHPGEAGNFQTLELTYLSGESSIEQVFDLPLDLSPYSSLATWVYGDESGSLLKIDLASGSQHLFSFSEIIDWSGWRKAKFSLDSPATTTGNPDLARINRIRITLEGNQAEGWSTIWLDDLGVSGRKPADGTAKRAAAKWKSERACLAATFRDLAPGFYPFEPYYQVEEDINDIRIYDIEANLDPLNYLWVGGGYKNRLRRKSRPLEERIQAYIYSTSLGLGNKQGSRFDLGFAQEKEHDLKDIHSLDHIKTDYLVSFNILTESTPLMGAALDFFGRHKLTDYKDQAHASHNRSNQSYLRMQIARREGIKIIPSYRLKQVNDRLTHQKVSRSESLDIDLDLTPSDKWIGFVRYTTADQDSFGIERKDITKSGLINTRFTPFDSLRMETNYETNYFKAREGSSEDISRDRRGDLKFYLTPFSFMSTTLGTSWAKKIGASGSSTKSEGCSADLNFTLLKIIKPLNAVALASNLKTRYDRKKNYQAERSSVTETYTGTWQTNYKKGISTEFNYTKTIRDGSPQTKTPYLMLSFSPRKYLTVSTDMRLEVNEVTKAENRTYSLGIDYRIRPSMQMSFLHNWLNANEASMTKRITTRLVWDITDYINCDLRYDWNDFDETDRDEADYFSHQVSMDVVSSF
ncbi:MAG: hypothetical protein AB1797_04870 [bacterium]